MHTYTTTSYENVNASCAPPWLTHEPVGPRATQRATVQPNRVDKLFLALVVAT